MGITKQQQIGKKKGKEKQSYIKMLNEYKLTGKVPVGITKGNSKKLCDYVDRECEILWKNRCWAKWGKALDGGSIDKKYFNVKPEQPWQVHHLIGRTHSLTRWDVDNGIIITSGVHDYLTNHDKDRFHAWLKEKYPERYKWREEHLIRAYGYKKELTLEEMIFLKLSLLP